ncbi:MAG: caspase family protein [Cyclobacteriaceae bacterium]
MRALTITFLLGVLIQAYGQKLDLVIPTGHTTQIYDIEISADTSWVASIDTKPEIIIWDYQTSELLYLLKGHTQAVKAIAFHAETNQLLSVGADGQMIIWEVGKQKIVNRVDLASPLVSGLWDQNEAVVVSKDGTLSIWSGSVLKDSINLNIGEATSLAISSSHWVVGDADGQIHWIAKSDRSQINTKSIAQSDIGTLTHAPNEGLYAGTNRGELILLNEEFMEISREEVMNLRTYDLQHTSQGTAIAGRDANAPVKLLMDGSMKDIQSLSNNVTDERSNLGVRAICWSVPGKQLLIGDFDESIGEYDIQTGQRLKQFRGTASPVFDIDVTPSNDKLVIGTGHDHARIIDLKGLSPVEMLKEHQGGARSVAYHPVQERLVTVSNDQQIKVWNADMSLSKTYDASGKYSGTPTEFDPTGRYLIRKRSDKHFDVYHLDEGKDKKIKIANGLDYQFSPDGTEIIFRTREGLEFYNTGNMKSVRKMAIADLQDFDIQNDKILSLLRDDQTIQTYSSEGVKVGEVKLESDRIDQIVAIPNKDFAVGFINSVKRGSSIRDFSLKLINLKTGEVENRLTGHDGFISEIRFIQDGKFMLTAARDGKLNIYEDLRSSDPLGTIVPLDEGEMIVLTPGGLFDATPKAMTQLHYSKGGVIMALDQMKQHYYEPDLLPRLLGLKDEPLPVRKPVEEVKPFPELQIKHPNKNNGLLGVSVVDNGGGIGRIEIFINNKEVSREIPGVNHRSGNLEVNYEVAGHPFLKESSLNTVTIKAFNEEGSLSTKPRNIYVFNKTDGMTKREPSLYAVIVGTSDYEGEALDLNYAAKDATDFADALKLSAVNEYGPERTDIRLLTTNNPAPGMMPTKENITRQFAEIATKAKARDLLVVYFSGHGVNHGQDVKDFYYLTMLTPDGVLTDSTTRAKVAISSSEMTQLITQVPALKQVMIIDACHSGRLASQLTNPGELAHMPASQTKALEEIKDRTGLYVIAGSEADAVSYEASLFEQGLLTYSILFGMKGAALKENSHVDIIDLLQFVANKVPELAADIGGVQRPEVRMPLDGESFSIGSMTDEDKEQIKILDAKPIFIHTGFQDDEQFQDVLSLSYLVDDELLKLSKEDKAPITFLDKKKFAGAYEVRGRYHRQKDMIHANVRVFRNGNPAFEFEQQGVNAEVVAALIVKELLTGVGFNQ